jgi:hypothetical protein
VINATISECSNGLPSSGDYVPGDDGNLYRVLAIVGQIHTGNSAAKLEKRANVRLTRGWILDGAGTAP